MVGDYISREAILGYLNDIWLTTTPMDSTPAEDKQLAICRCMGLQDAMDAVKEFPAADVAPVRHGQWINGRCSECGEHAPFWAMATTYHLSQYCHGCGAKMDG